VWRIWIFWQVQCEVFQRIVSGRVYLHHYEAFHLIRALGIQAMCNQCEFNRKQSPRFLIVQLWELMLSSERLIVWDAINQEFMCFSPQEVLHVIKSDGIFDSARELSTDSAFLIDNREGFNGFGTCDSVRRGYQPLCLSDQWAYMIRITPSLSASLKRVFHHRAWFVYSVLMINAGSTFMIDEHYVIQVISV
jgi:hypothetical protein